MLLDPLILKVIAIGLGLMFLVAAYHKLSEAGQFRITLLEYQVIPEALVAPASRVIPIIELLLGGCLAAGLLPRWHNCYRQCLVTRVYALAIGINIQRGRVHFDCGCGFGGKSDNEQYLSGGLLIRNIVLIAAALVTLIPAAPRMIGFSDYLTMLAALLAGALLFGAANQLLANRAAIDTWRKGK